jgi:hypothetical protein
MSESRWSGLLGNGQALLDNGRVCRAKTVKKPVCAIRE